MYERHDVFIQCSSLACSCKYRIENTQAKQVTKINVRLNNVKKPRSARARKKAKRIHEDEKIKIQNGARRVSVLNRYRDKIRIRESPRKDHLYSEKNSVLIEK